MLDNRSKDLGRAVICAFVLLLAAGALFILPLFEDFHDVIAAPSGFALYYLALTTYAVGYFTPVILLLSLIMIFKKILKRDLVIGLPFKIFFVLYVSIVQVLLTTDAWLYQHYDFHINGFVINLIMTPGGIASMGMSDSTEWAVLAAVAGIFVLNGFLFWICEKLIYKKPIVGQYLKLRYLMSFFVLAFICQGFTFAYMTFKGSADAFAVQDLIPAYKRITCKTLLRKLGVTEVPQTKQKFSKTSQLRYPLAKIELAKTEKLPNIVWIVAESWRWDMLNPEIMPNTYAFAQKNLHFLDHYSGGNGTRMGMFTMFTGIYGNYWFDFLKQQRGALIFNILKRQNYNVTLYTSSSFTYPEFDRTIFSSVPRNLMHTDNDGYGWERDRRNVTRMLSEIKNFDKSKPFMAFMFFESPHARYYFPEQDMDDYKVMATPYLKDFNYLTTDLHKEIGQIKNRYINSVHYMDTQYGRLFKGLEEQGLLDNTIVIVTGDHGEEFMEKNKWGHNSSFVQEQIRVPLIVHLPGAQPQEITRMTNHIDIIPSLLPRLGVINPPADYCLGYSLFDEKRGSPYMVVTDWANTAVITADFKQKFAMRAQTMLNFNSMTDLNDHKLTGTVNRELYRQVIIEAMQNSHKFSGS